MRSVAIAIGITWSIAFVIAIVVAYMSAWPLALFNGGDPGAGWALGFVLGGAGAGWWALRTTRSLLRDHASDSDVFRRPWPVGANVEGLVEAGLLDRRRQPGPRSSWGNDLTADLRGGERAERMLVADETLHLHVAVDGPEGTTVSFVEVDRGEQLARIVPGSPQRIALEPGRWRVVLERPAPNDGRRGSTHTWWIAEAPAAR